jgi:hypothetical protein
LFKTVPIKARYITTDELGNIYLVRNDNTLLRYNESGDSTGFYKSVLNGDIGFVDATNPLRVLVYYSSYYRVALLDRMMALKNNLDLRKINIANSTAIASSTDGNMWIYDRFNARLKKIDDQLNEILSGNDLRQQLQTVPIPSFMTERNWKVYLCDSSKGIFVFDRYANYINTIPIKGVNYLQLQESKMIYQKNDSLFAWNWNTANESIIPLPQVANQLIIHACILRNRLYVLYNDALRIYNIETD